MARIGDGGDLLKCSFCGKSQKQVKKLIAGPGVYICDECIDLCNEIIEEELSEGTYGQSSDIEIQANEILRMRELLEKMIAEHSGRSQEDVSRDIERDKILTAEAAVEYGLIDAVLESRKGALPVA